MNIFKKIAFNFGKKMLLNQLNKPALKFKVVNMVNNKVDIPRLTEKQEEQLFNAVYDAIKAYLIVEGK